MKQPKKNLIGQKFGLLTVLEFIEYRQRGNSSKKGAVYKFKCECGTICEKFIHYVKSGNTKTCGDLQHRRKTTFSEDLSEIKFGRLEVVEFLRLEPNIRNNIYRTIEIWKCKCECENFTELTRNQIISKSVLSCGCLLQEKRGSNPYHLPSGVAALNDYYAYYKNRAKIKNLEFSLSKIEFEKLIYQHCYYCNTKPYREHPKNNQYYGQIIINGIDRNNSNLGYTTDNCVTCCEICNKAKRDLTLERFIEWMKKIQKSDIQKLEKTLLENTLDVSTKVLSV